MLLVFVLAWLPFLGALEHGFVALDDDYNFERNPHILSFSAQNLRWMFGSSYVGHYQPLTWLSIALDVELAGGLSPRAIHRTSLFLHAVTAALFCLFCFQVQSARMAAKAPDPAPRLALFSALSALLFALHPLRVESVVWATERRDVLSGALLMACLACWMRFVARGSRPARAFAVLFFVLSLLAKAWGITLPLVLLVLDKVLARDRELSWRALVREKLLWFAPFALSSAALAAWAQGGASALMPWAEHGALARLAQACYGLWFYVGKSLWPTRLSPLIELEHQLDPWRPLYLAAIAGVGLACLVLMRLGRARGIPHAFLAYALIVSPVLGFLQSGAQKVADRYSYLACMPLALLAAMGALAFERRATKAGRAVLVSVLALVCTALALASWRQSAVWRDSESLYRRVVEVEPDNYFGRHMLSVSIGQKGPAFRAEAIEHSKASVRAHPRRGNEAARAWLGSLLAMTGQTEQALEAWRGAIEVAPTCNEALRELARHALASGDSAQALALYERALEHDPRFTRGYLELAKLYASTGNHARLASLWPQALRHCPGWSAALAGLGRSEIAGGRTQAGLEALESAQRAALETQAAYEAPWHDPADANRWFAELLIDIGLAHAQLGRAPAAQAAYALALRYDPSSQRARQLLGP